MYYTGLDPMTMKEVYVPKTKHEKAMQRALLQFKNPKYYTLVYEALTTAGRTDLIGNGPKCLIRDKSQGNNNSNNRFRRNDKNSYTPGKLKDKNDNKHKGKNENGHESKVKNNRSRNSAASKGKTDSRNKSRSR
jgi:hypothetical protein